MSDDASAQLWSLINRLTDEAFAEGWDAGVKAVTLASQNFRARPGLEHGEKKRLIVEFMAANPNAKSGDCFLALREKGITSGYVRACYSLMKKAHPEADDERAG